MRTFQTIGRGIRNLSHCALPYSKRNCQIFLHSTNLSTEYEAIDMYMYRIAEKKGVKIGKISRLMKENAIDCHLNYEQDTHFYENFNGKTVFARIIKRRINYVYITR